MDETRGRRRHHRGFVGDAAPGGERVVASGQREDAACRVAVDHVHVAARREHLPGQVAVHVGAHQAGSPLTSAPVRPTRAPAAPTVLPIPEPCVGTGAPGSERKPNMFVRTASTASGPRPDSASAITLPPALTKRRRSSLRATSPSTSLWLKGPRSSETTSTTSYWLKSTVARFSISRVGCAVASS